MNATTYKPPFMVRFSDPEAPRLLPLSLSQEGSGFVLLTVNDGEMGIWEHELDAMLDENIAYLERASFQEKMKSIYLHDEYKDGGWFPLAAEGETGGVPNLNEYLHHRYDRRGIDFKGYDFKNTWSVYKAIYRLVGELYRWLVEAMPAGHAAIPTMQRLMTQIDYEKRSILRVLKYYPRHPFMNHPDGSPILPPLDLSGKVRIWNDPHEDVALMTLIPIRRSSTGRGLQPMDTQGMFHDLPPISPELRKDGEIIFVINTGDVLSVASGGQFALCEHFKRPDGTTDKFHNPLIVERLREPQKVAQQWRKGYYHRHRRLRLIKQGHYRSTTHRVIMPEGTTEVRYSTPIFIHPVGWAEVSGPWYADDKMIGYVRNKEAQRDKAMEDILRHNQQKPA